MVYGNKPEVERSGLLSKPTAGDDADAGPLQQRHAVEKVRLLPELLRGFDRFGRDRDLQSFCSRKGEKVQLRGQG
jgi:hypothetical protein